MVTNAEHYAAAVKAWDDAYAERNGLPRIDWDAIAAELENSLDAESILM